MINAKDAREIANAVDVVELLLNNVERCILNQSEQGVKSMSHSLGIDDKIRKKVISKLKKNGYSVEKSEAVLGWYVISW